MIRTILVFSLLLLTATGCNNGLVRLDQVTPVERQQVLSGELVFPDNYQDLKLPEDDVFAVTPEMARFAEKAMAGARSDERKIRNLLQALMSPEQMGLQFEESGTYTAREAFERGRANCLAFTSMVIPMLRQQGMNVSFNDVEIPPVWNLENNETMILYRHINAIVMFNDRFPKVIDINMGEYDSSFIQQTISDQTAEAQYYNNRSVELLIDGRLQDAFRYQRKAIDLDNEVAFFWVNLAMIYRKMDNLRAAEIAVRLALEIDADNPVVISSAENIYRKLGRTELVAWLEQRSANYRRRNPYYHYSVAMDAFLHKNYAVALDSVNEAIRRHPVDHRFHFLQGAIYVSLDQDEQARESLGHAVELTTNPKQQDRYRRKIEIMM